LQCFDLRYTKIVVHKNLGYGGVMESRNKYLNIAKATQIGNASWSLASQYGLTDLGVEHIGNSYLRDQHQNEFMNMCSCSYLGLEIHPLLVQRAAEYIIKAGTVNLPTSRIRIRLRMLDEVEDALSDYFDCQALTALSCSAATVAVLPLLAAGLLTNGQRPVILFDKHAHFSLNQVKAICGDETEIINCPHNDMNFVEEVCKKYPLVAYVADGAYSMGGSAPVADLLKLQEKFGMFLYFDDSHSLSAYGKKGEGYVRSFTPELNDRTILVYSLAKAFGANGGGIFMAKDNKYSELIRRFGGPMSYSQYINPATIGAAIASLDIHKTSELQLLQEKLYTNIREFDKRIITDDIGSYLPIRVVIVGDPDAAIDVSKRVYQRGYYTSAVFFPIVAKGKSGLRIMLRADMQLSDVIRFCDVLTEEVATVLAKK